MSTIQEVMVRKEYVRWLHVNLMEKLAGRLVPDQKKRYEALNCLERWLVTLANISGTEDAIFTLEKLAPGSESIEKFRQEVKGKNIDKADNFVEGCVYLASAFAKLDDSVFENGVTDVAINDNNVVVTDGKNDRYSRELPHTVVPNLTRLAIGSGSEDPANDIAKMAMRYSSLLPRGQQWNIPLAVYSLLVEKYGVTIEGFASPINSQIIRLGNYNFCSLFPDTDWRFGSIGSFFNQKFDNVTVMANPPYVLSVMDEMSRHIIRCFDSSTNLRFIICMSDWKDTEYYQTFSQSQYTKTIIELGRHYFENSNNNGERILSKFRTLVIVLSKGYPDLDYDEFERDVRKAYTP